ncbi:MAG: CheY-like chemotaxis protein [Rickettsiales bacterium]|jgi:CheY-like chemotaxis protein
MASLKVSIRGDVNNLDRLMKTNIDCNKKIKPQSPVNSNSGQQTLLLADDNKVVTIATSHKLTQMGYDVLTAINGDEVIEIMENNNCDILLIDTNMVDSGDGLRTIKLIRDGLIFNNFKNFRTIPIIDFSADFDDNSQKLAFESGTSACLQKPFDEKKFLQIIENLSNKG